MKTVYYNAKVYVDSGHFEQAVLVEDGLIKKVGGNKEVLDCCDSKTERVDCKGYTLIPGLNDAHLHFMQLGETMYQVPIEGVKSIDEMVLRCHRFIDEHPERVKNGMHATGWNQDLFTGSRRMPDRHDLDRISTRIPIVLERVCGHILSTNTKAIEMLGLTGSSPQYSGGEFLIGDDGYPSGIFKENACNYAKDIIPDFTIEERRRILIECMDYAVSMGLTSVQSNDVGTSFMDGPAAFRMFHDIYDNGQGKIRYQHQVCFNDLGAFEKYLTEGEFTRKSKPDSWLTIGPLKLFKDGSLGARTALMKNDYADDPGNHGLEWISADEMDEYCRLAKKYSVQIVTHCIGDKAVEETVKAYEKAFVNGKNSLRHALNHCQITDSKLIDRIVRDDILVIAQPIFLDYDMQIVEDRCGKGLAGTSYAFGSLHRKGVHVAYSTDCPVESLNPFENIYMAVTRKDKNGRPDGGFYSQECVDVETAVDAYTKESAYAQFMEDRKGRIYENYYADFVLLDRDIFSIDPMEIKETRPLMTVVGGKIMYCKDI